jgi:hypothetical protein
MKTKHDFEGALDALDYYSDSMPNEDYETLRLALALAQKVAGESSQAEAFAEKLKEQS